MTPLMEAAVFGFTANARALLDWGADVNATSDRGTALIWAAGSDRASPELIRLLLDRGADPNAVASRCERCIHEPRSDDGGPADRADAGPTTRRDRDRQDAACRRRHPLMSQEIDHGCQTQRLCGCRASSLISRAPHAQNDIRGQSRRHEESHVAAGERSDVDREVGLCLVSSPGVAGGERCAGAARGFAVDEEAARQRVQATLARFARPREELFQDPAGIGLVAGGALGAGYALLGLAAARVPPNATTDAMAHFIAARQLADGRFRSPDPGRLPLEGSDVTATALAIRALQVYAPGWRWKRRRQRIISRARDWLLSARTDRNRGKSLSAPWSRLG